MWEEIGDRERAGQHMNYAGPNVELECQKGGGSERAYGN